VIGLGLGHTISVNPSKEMKNRAGRGRIRSGEIRPVRR
jgi:hypothetical protein